MNHLTLNTADLLKSTSACILALLVTVLLINCADHSHVTTYSLTYDGNGNSGGSVPIDSKAYAKGMIVTVLDNTGGLTRSGYIFTGWNSLADGSGDTYTSGSTFTMASINVTLYAIWTPALTVTYNGNGNTGGSVPMDSKNYTNGAIVTVFGNTEGLTKSGYTFTCWNLLADGSGKAYSPGATFAMASGSVTLYAIWTPVYTVTYNGNGNTGGTVPVDNNFYLFGSVATTLYNTGNLTKIGFVFSDWNTAADGTGASYNGSSVIEIGHENIVLYAKWVASGSMWSAPGSLPTLTSGTWNSVTSGNGNFVAVSNGQISAASSDNGTTWTQGTLSDNSVVSVSYGAGPFVAVSNSKSAYTSPDGITWTSQTLPVNDAYSSVTYGNSTFVAVCHNSTTSIASSNGASWTKGSLPVSAYWTSVAYGNNTFVAVAGLGTDKSATSQDGITWTQQTMPVSASWYSVTYGNGIFVAICANSVATSSDGVTWASHALPSSGQWYVTFGNGVFVASDSPTKNVATSSDGVSWTLYSLPSSAYWSSTAYGNSTFMTISQTGNVTISH